MSKSFFLTRHLRDADETYLGHLRFTVWASTMLVGGGLAVLAHGLCPCVFIHTGSRVVERLHTELQARKAACADRANNLKS